ncbi:transcription initiation protein spt4 [Blyttiomyces helicus]|uniref:Transcription elongation factor SPT4 n=1 Tax=Blyttiomyces helicus TaxID=388810 RepID=A0A4P9WHR4_9FUNG|nr:transcription initiation protein spt4 [Blyttiomyces helicus]|eukprot:RKO92284.1 transcription initiation protein spt4 [Blyttiomyces helicus]
MADLPSAGAKSRLRACLLCSLIKTAAQFKTGCDNCEGILRRNDKLLPVDQVTSANFDGVVALMDPSQSWVGKWQRIDKFKPGLYAIRVSGRLPVEMEEALAERGFKYRPRDGSVHD